jgi:pimeloyl-ACP methyl ester carboxylesterase
VSTNRNVYALLVGIDHYPAPVPTLHGCRNDITAMEQLLNTRVSAYGVTLHVQTLLDEQATRTAVINGFRRHLGRADNGDVALFYYSGHGSQEPAPEQWWEVEPDHLDETLVLYDSRQPGQWDLADKELAVLLQEVARQRPHVLVVLDCCHSGSGTRATLEDGIAERRAPTDARQRPIGSFLFAADQASSLTRAASERGPLGDSGWALPQADHVLLAGCRSNETSKEVLHDGHNRGAMSAALEVALTMSGIALTYRDLHRQVSANVRAKVRNQNPQLETSAASDLDRSFLGGALAEMPPYFVVTHEETGWIIDGGIMHGIAAPVGIEATLLEIQTAAGQSVAVGKVTTVQPGTATITVTPDHALNEARSYRGMVTATPLPPMLIRIDGDIAQAGALRIRLGQRDEDGPLLVSEALRGVAPAVLVTANDDGFTISRAGNNRPLCPRAATPDQAVAMLEHIASWMRVATLHNGSTRLSHDVISVHVEAERELSDRMPDEVDGHYRFSYLPSNGGSRPRRYTVTLTNTTERSLWVAVLDLTDTYGVYTDALPAGSIALAAGEAKPIRFAAEVPDELARQGVTEVTDLLKLIVSTEEFDPRSLAQDDLDVTTALRVVASVRAVPKSSLDRLLHRVGTRRARPETADDEPAADWFTRDLQVTAVRPGAAAEIAADKTIELARGVRIAAHPRLRATCLLTSSADATRDLVVAPVPELLHDIDAMPFGLVATRGGEAEADSLVVELHEGTDLAVVTEEAPLIVQLDQKLEPDEHVLPFAWDGEFYIPLGYSRQAEAGSEIVLQRLSDPVVTDRSLKGSIRILFRKLVAKRLGLAYEYPLLRMVSVGDDGTVTYEEDRVVIAAAVANAAAVLLYVHGIIGDTEGMARSSRLSGAAKALGTHYDLILTFDYENLDTPIEVNARSLKDRLAAVGLADHHGKRFDIVAHSMGGLVCRHMIELIGGVSVDRLVMLGTPSGGSPWPTVQKWSTAAIAFAANSMTVVAWPVAAVANVLAAIEKIDTALDQMQKDSPFLGQLAAAPDPGLPYHVIIGDRSLIQSAPAGRIERLLARLSPRRIASDLVDLAFFLNPNDLAVAVSSARDVPIERAPTPTFYVLASDHVSFFVTEASLTKMADVLVV